MNNQIENMCQLDICLAWYGEAHAHTDLRYLLRRKTTSKTLEAEFILHTLFYSTRYDSSSASANYDDTKLSTRYCAYECFPLYLK